MTPTRKPTIPLSLRTPYVNHGKTLLAASLPALLLSPTVMAQDEPIVLDTMQIEERTIDTNPYAEAGAPYKAKVSGDSRHVKELADTPQTISVLTQTQIQESGRSDLREILSAQPGITLGTGENGNAFGDRYIIRGQEARSDVFVDGLRDPGMTIRESFATEQVEVTKGPSSTFAGRGSTGGAINSVTKQASPEYDFANVQAGLGTDNYRRLTLDTNQKINPHAAVRINLLHAYEEVPDRAPTDRERNGIALSAWYQASDNLKLVADYYYLDGKDTPDLGTYIRPNGGKPVNDLPVYAQEQDFLESTVDTFTLRANYQLASTMRIENALRYGTTDNGYVVTGARGTTRHASDPLAPGGADVSLSTHQGWQQVEYFVDQFNFFYDLELGGLTHQWLIGAEYSDLRVKNGVFNVSNNGSSNCTLSGRGGISAGYCIYDGQGNVTMDLGRLMGRQIARGDQDSDFNVETLSLSLMDTIDINPHWSLFLGLRIDSFDYHNTVVSRGNTQEYRYDDTLVNGHAGVVYHLSEDANLYFTYSTSADINGGESDVGGSCGYGGLCGDPVQVTNSKPERTRNLELGSKWELFDDKLLLTAAVFQITKDDVMESVGDDYESLGTLNTGKNRVQGIELSMSGNLSDNLSAQFGMSMMDAEVLEAYNPTHVGKVLSNFADDSLFLQLRYQVSDSFSFGGSMSYSSEMYAGQPDTAAAFNSDTGKYNYQVPSYRVFDLFANYQASEQLGFRLNIGNVTNKDYYLAAYRSGAFTYIGDARHARLTVTYAF